MIIIGVLSAVVILFIYKAVLVIPNQQAAVIERLGKFHVSLFAGFHIIIPFVDRVAYTRTLKEEVYEVPKQTCITSDNVSINIDGIIYLQVINPEKSAYGIENYYSGAMHLAQTSLRSAIGKLELDKTFEGRVGINLEVVDVLNAATIPWGIKVLRYEIRDIEPPLSVMQAMEKQMQAEREKRAIIFESQAEQQRLINIALGRKESLIAESEGELEAKKNQAEGDAVLIIKQAEASAAAIEAISTAVIAEGGADASTLFIAEKYIAAFSSLAKEGNTMIIPQDIASVAGMLASMKTILK